MADAKKNEALAVLKDKIGTAVARAKAAPIGSKFWQGEKDGDHIACRITSLALRPKYRRPKELGFGPEAVDIDTGEITILPSHAVLEKLFEREKISVGDVVVICFRGIAENKKKGNKNAAKLYTLEVVERAAPSA